MSLVVVAPTGTHVRPIDGLIQPGARALACVASQRAAYPELHSATMDFHPRMGYGPRAVFERPFAYPHLADFSLPRWGRRGLSSEVRTMPDVADETAYYFNRNIPAVALISKGVRFPRGAWMRVANATVPAAQVEQMLGKIFPELKGKVLAFATLTNESEVDELERSLP